ncbi:MAG: NAD(P)/FAD-dependent oxidoreductase [Pseudomonadota bacterium]
MAVPLKGDGRPVLVVGLGLAGALVTLALQRRGVDVVVADSGEAPTSRAAAGLVSPINGPRLSRPPRTAEWLAAATDLYAEAEQRLGRRLWYPGPIRRIFRDAEQARRWEARRAEPERAVNMAAAEPPGTLPGGRDPHGSGVILGGGRLDVAGLLAAVAAEREAAGARIGPVDPRKLTPVADGIALGGDEYAAAVLCRGWTEAGDSWFPDLPLEPLAGESLALHLPEGTPAQPIHGSGWLAPTGSTAARLGATHTRAESEGPTAAGRAELLAALPDLWSGEAEVVDHFAGTRVAVRDRAPVAGSHPGRPRLAILNGLGGKGALWGPWCATALAAHLVDGTAMPAEVDPARFGAAACG